MISSATFQNHLLLYVESGTKPIELKSVFFIIELFVPTNALRQFFHCFFYYKDAPIRI
jgi:hypothetical protein